MPETWHGSFALLACLWFCYAHEEILLSLPVSSEQRETCGVKPLELSQPGREWPVPTRPAKLCAKSMLNGVCHQGFYLFDLQFQCRKADRYRHFQHVGALKLIFLFIINFYFFQITASNHTTHCLLPIIPFYIRHLGKISWQFSSAMY